MTLHPIEQLAARLAAERDAALADASEQRRAAGIVHTPASLARAVVRVADELVREQLGLDRGLCDPAFLLIDPACGPGAFLAAALALAEERGAKRVNAVGYDIDPAALAWAARLREHGEIERDGCPGAHLELVQADVLRSDLLLERVRQHHGPLAVIGNPPWATVRAQPSARDQARLQPFRSEADGERLAERKLGVLSDAYVRFFALCAELARAAEGGALVGLVTNASFLDGPVHRGMRARLLEWFDEISVLDLGGSALLGRQRAQRDDNVFGVRPNVAIIWLCRHPRHGKNRGRARYARTFGSRAEKLELLDHATLATLELTDNACEAPAFSFVPRPRGDARYAQYLSLSEWLPFHREGVQSNRDAVVVAEHAEHLRARLQAFCRGERLPELAQAYRSLPHYDPDKARAALRAALDAGQDPVLRIAYRPWDERVFCNVAPLCHRPRPLLAAALQHGGFALLSVRKDRGDMPWRHVSAAASTVDNCYLSARSSCRTRAFPSYTPDGAENLGLQARELLAAVGCGSCTPTDAQHYLLAVLSARSYQACWDSELHHDYPRVPPPPDADSFRRLVALGAELARLHASPCEATAHVPDPEPQARFKQLVLDSVAGELRLTGTVLVSLPHGALDLRIGQVQPLAAYLAQRAQRTLDRASLQAVYGRAERLCQLAKRLVEVDTAVIECFGQFRRL
jgi:hypothetical protein